jgi:hypothetical protein
MELHDNCAFFLEPSVTTTAGEHASEFRLCRYRTGPSVRPVSIRTAAPGRSSCMPTLKPASSQTPFAPIAGALFPFGRACPGTWSTTNRQQCAPVSTALGIAPLRAGARKTMGSPAARRRSMIGRGDAPAKTQGGAATVRVTLSTANRQRRSQRVRQGRRLSGLRGARPGRSI